MLNINDLNSWINAEVLKCCVLFMFCSVFMPSVINQYHRSICWILLSINICLSVYRSVGKGGGSGCGTCAEIGGQRVTEQTRLFVMALHTNPHCKFESLYLALNSIVLVLQVLNTLLKLLVWIRFKLRIFIKMEQIFSHKMKNGHNVR